MITMETATRIWQCHNEIRKAKDLLDELEDRLKAGGDPNPRDANDRRVLQLGIPSGDNGHRLYGVQPRLALSVIRAHIADQQAELVEANEQARIELGA